MLVNLININKYEDIQNQLERKHGNLIYLEKQDFSTDKTQEKYKFEYREINYYKSEIESFFEEIKNALSDKKSVYILVEKKEKAKKLKEILEKEEIIANIEEKLDKTIVVKSTEKIVTIGIGKLS